MKELFFSQNWNNKLNCNSFSTVRLFNEKKYIFLDPYKIYLRESSYKLPKYLGIAKLQIQYKFFLNDVTPGITFIDANLSKLDFILMVKKMYKNRNVDFNTQKFSFMVFQYTEKIDY